MFFGGGKIGLSFVRSRRRPLGFEMEGRTEVLELLVLVRSSNRVLWEDVLHVTLSMLPDGDRTVEFCLVHLFNSECRILFHNEELQSSRSGGQFIVL